MAKNKTAFICSTCGYQSVKWSGKCPNCNEWNTLEEQIIIENSKKNSLGALKTNISATTLNEINIVDEHRYITGISEFDRVLGGGIVKGSVVLLGGDPGIGKSTILLQVCNSLKGLNILYISGEESPVQIKLRANRLGVVNEKLSIMGHTDTEEVCEYIKIHKPDIVMIDSIQTMSVSELTAMSGSIVQVRESAKLLLNVAKSLDIPIFLVGHVNKGGDIAGPKILEHIVDTVLYFEGDKNQSYRILRANKNRFGSTNEIGVFEMLENGLHGVENPSMTLLSGRIGNVSGSTITCVMEGSRPILAEVQGLVSSTGFGNPRRMSAGFDFNRLNLLLAVLEKREGLYFSNLDVYTNIIGGLRIDEPGADLAVAMSLVSALRDIPIDEDTVVFGEIGLSGEIRAVNRINERLVEASRLGFKKCIIPKSCLKLNINSLPIEIIGVKNLKEALSLIK